MTPTETDQQAAEAEFKSILYDASNPRHELLMRGDPATRDHMSELSKRAHPEPPSEPPPTPVPPVPQPATAKPTAESWGSLPAELSATELAELQAETARGIEELKGRWGGNYEANMRAMAEVRDGFFNPHSADDMRVREIINGAVGNDLRFIMRLQELKAEVGDQLKSTGAADTSGMTRQQQESKVIAFAQFVLRDLKSLMSQAILEAVGDDRDGLFFNWALKNAVKIFGR